MDSDLNLLVQRETRELFLKCANSIDDWNARAVFVELLHIPTPEDIKTYCCDSFVETWRLQAKSTGFFSHLKDTGRTDYSTVYTKEEVRGVYFEHVERVAKTVLEFRLDGVQHLLELAATPGLEDTQKVLLMLDYRLKKGIPTKEPIDLDEAGRVVCRYPRCIFFQGQWALLQAAGLA